MSKLITAESVRDWLMVESKNDFYFIGKSILSQEFDMYIGWTGYGNLGDEALLEIHKKMFSYLNVKHSRVCRPSGWMVDKLRLKVPVGVGILGGGTLIDQSIAWLFQINYLLNHNIPMFCFGTGVASHDFWEKHPGHRTSGHMAEWASSLGKFKYVGVRGPLSQRHLKEFGLDTEVLGDAAFSLASKDYKNKKASKQVGLNVGLGQPGSMWGTAKDLEQNVISLTKALIDEGFEVDLLPIWKEDIPSNERILTQVNDRRCRLVKKFNNYVEYSKQLEKYDLFIGQKLHATIFATLSRIPSIMLEYRPKCRDYMESIDMGEFNVRTDKIGVDSIMAKVDKLLSSHHLYRNHLNSRVMYYKNLQIKRAGSLKSILGK